MTKRFLVLCSRLLICLMAVCSLPACVSQYTVQALHDLNPAAEIIDTCVRIPTVESGTSVAAFKRSTGETVSDRDRDKFEQFAETADVFYLYDPNAPRQTPQRLPWPYEHMTCDTLSSPKTPPLPKGMVEIPISQAMREALVATLTARDPDESPSLLSELTKQPVEKRFLAQAGPSLMTLPPMRAKEQLDEVSQMLRDSIRQALPTIPRQNVHGPTGEQISIIDTKTGQVIGGALSGVPGVVVPGGALITDAIIASGIMPQPTREFMVGKGGVEIVGGLVQVFVGGSTAIGGAGATATGGGAIVGVPVCVAGVALATNGAITFLNGAKTVIVAVCHWNELPKAADTPALASTSLSPQSAGPAPAAAQATSVAGPSSAAKGARPAAQQTTSTPSTGQTPAPAKPTVPLETTTTTRFKSTGKTVTKRGETTTTTTPRVKPSGSGKAAGPAPNGGAAKPHGGKVHDAAIDREMARLRQDPAVSNIRKNQQQVDANGNKVGTNRPDIQYDKNGNHHCVEFDTNPSNGSRHNAVIQQNDPATNVHLQTP